MHLTFHLSSKELMYFTSHTNGYKSLRCKLLETIQSSLKVIIAMDVVHLPMLCFNRSIHWSSATSHSVFSIVSNIASSEEEKVCT